MTTWVFLTGGAGFIGGAVARVLRDRGNDVIAVVRDPSSATALQERGVRLLASNLVSSEAIHAAMDVCDAVIHVAGSYRIGLAPAERPAMYEANVAVTERVLDAAIAAGIPRIVHVSSANVLGNTRGVIVDENHYREPGDGYVSYYDETKYLAHRIAAARIGTGAQIIIAMPGTTYGPGDHSALGTQLQAAFNGTARYVLFGASGISPVHVDDVAAGIVAALDRGRIGQSYLLGGENLTLRDAMGIAARANGKEPPTTEIPNAVLRALAALGRVGSRLARVDGDLREVVRAADGVTYWTTHAKATAELDYAPRDFATGVVDAFGPP
jgi:nucleoside-diphosphate-sugar epimerase